MKPVRHLLPAAIVAAALQASGWLSPAAADPKSPDVAYHAPSWWIAAVVKGTPSALMTGNPQNDRRLKVWLVGFGYGIESRCAQPTAPGTKALEAALARELDTGPAMRPPGQKGVQDGQRLADINGCTARPRLLRAGPWPIPMPRSSPPHLPNHGRRLRPAA